MAQQKRTQIGRQKWLGAIAVLALSVLALSPAAVLAQNAKKIALVGGTVIDALDPEPIRNGVVLIEGERIVAVGPQAQIDIPRGYEVISTEGMSVMPGLWDMHVHLMINGHADYGHWDKVYLKRQREEIMPASAAQLLLAGVTSARDLGGPLEDSIETRRRIAAGEIPGPRLMVSGPFIQKRPYPNTEEFRWGVDSPEDARAKVNRLADAGVDVIKLIDHDQMTLEEARAVVDAAHARGLKVVGHSHRPEEVRRGLEIGVDNFEHTGFATAPEYPADVIAALRERTAQMNLGPLFWTPTVEGLWNYDEVRTSHEHLDNECWKRGLKDDTIADIKGSIAHPERIPYFQITPARKPTLPRKIAQLRESGAVLLIGTDSGIPLKFHCQSTWNELDVWTRVMGIPMMEAIRAATWWPAVMAGKSEDLGALTPGRFADIIAVKGDILRYPNLLQDVDFVMKGGVVYKRDGAPVEAALAYKK